MDDATMRQYAFVGAEIRLREIEHERRQILAMFPTLHDPAPAVVVPAADVTVVTDVTAVRPRGHRTFTKAQRRAISERVTAYWREQRKLRKAERS